ncbi:MAG: carboxypeptidase regulatory-like domain-containing protein, partial [Bacteroidetes bacterium]|nr:carboxypeptidase regulatory-like domain-containing protein [Bacteroidota bacterium]
MLKRLLITLVLGVCTQHLFSQTSNLSGKVQDTTANVAVKNAVVAVLSVKSSAMERFTRTDASGNFSLKNVNSGKHIPMVMHPLFAEHIEDIETS